MHEFHYTSPTTVGKVIFIGASTRQLGFGPSNVSVNDKVCILYRSNVHVLLRQSGPAYEVMGQCYFEDWMYGSLIDWEVEKQMN
jgi:hypothetical protein